MMGLLLTLVVLLGGLGLSGAMALLVDALHGTLQLSPAADGECLLQSQRKS